MEKYPRLFARMSLVYLAIGAMLGVHMTRTDILYSKVLFAHLHFMLIGFMCMMIFAVAYHILPRFNAAPITFPKLVPVHFWFANIGLVGMILTYAGVGSKGLFSVFGSLQLLGMLIFVVNLFPVLRDPKEESSDEATAAPETPKVKLTAQMTIADILNEWPHLENGMNELGLSDLSSEAVRESAAKMVTLPMAAKRLNMELGALIIALEGSKFVSQDGPSHPDHHLPVGQQITRGELATGSTQIGNLMEVYSETREVFSRNYGEACFTCPGQKTETLEQTAMMHGQPVDKIVNEINDVIQAALK